MITNQRLLSSVLKKRLGERQGKMLELSEINKDMAYCHIFFCLREEGEVTYQLDWIIQPNTAIIKCTKSIFCALLILSDFLSDSWPLSLFNSHHITT